MLTIPKKSSVTGKTCQTFIPPTLIFELLLIFISDDDCIILPKAIISMKLLILLDLDHAPISVLCRMLDNIECMPFIISQAVITAEAYPGTTSSHRDFPDYASLNVSFTNKPTVQASVVFQELKRLFTAKHWKPVAL